MDSHVARMEEGRITFKILTGKPTGKRPWRRRVDNVRMDFEEVGTSTRNLADSV